MSEKKKRPIAKRAVVFDGLKTSVSLEDAFWSEIVAIAKREKISIGKLVSRVSANRGASNLSSALRLFVLEDCKRRR